MPTKKYTITILNGKYKGQTIVKFSEDETDELVDYLKSVYDMETSVVVEDINIIEN